MSNAGSWPLRTINSTRTEPSTATLGEQFFITKKEARTPYLYHCIGLVKAKVQRPDHVAVVIAI